MRLKGFFGAALLASAAVASPVSAKVAIYTLTGTASGSVGTNNFSNAAFTLKSVADTSNPQQCFSPFGPVPGCTFFRNTSASIFVSGLGKYTVSSNTVSFLNATAQLFGVQYANGRVGGAGLVNFRPASGFNGWTLDEALPLTSGSTLALPPVLSPPLTDDGPLSFTFSSSPGTFQVSVGGVPEPATWALLTLGFGVIGAAMRRRDRARVALA